MANSSAQFSPHVYLETLGLTASTPLAEFRVRAGRAEVSDSNANSVQKDWRQVDASPEAALENFLEAHGLWSGNRTDRLAVGFLSYEFAGVLSGLGFSSAFRRPASLSSATKDQAWFGVFERNSFQKPILESTPSTALSLTPAQDAAFTYRKIVEEALRNIREGEIYQCNLSHALTGTFTGSAMEREAHFHLLRKSAPAPHAAYLSWKKDAALLSLSPETFLHLENGRITSRPIKGTARRGRNEAEDRAAIAALLNSEKERAELTMIVDLVRNDLGRICQPGSVRVPDLRRLESYATVHHMVGEVEGEIAADLRLTDLLRATFPPGSVTGAPKRRACEIIRRLEPEARGAFCGAIGWIGANRSLHLSVAIRTLEIDGERATLRVGSGIVSDSHPESEYQETLAKAAAFQPSPPSNRHLARKPGERLQVDHGIRND